MVTTKRVRVDLTKLERGGYLEGIAHKLNLPSEIVFKVENAIKEIAISQQRKPRDPVPEGGIGIREAARKYNIPHTSIINWMKNGDVGIISRVKNWTYLNEADIVRLLPTYQRGKVGRPKTKQN